MATNGSELVDGLEQFGRDLKESNGSISVDYCCVDCKLPIAVKFLDIPGRQSCWLTCSCGRNQRVTFRRRDT